MRNTLFTTLSMACCLVALAIQPVSGQGSQSPEQEIRALLEARDRQIKEIIGPSGTEINSEQREELKQIVNEIMHFEPMVRYALGNTWSEISETEREEFVAYFTTVVREQSLANLDIYRAAIGYESIVTNGDTATVRTVATYDDVRVEVDYDMEVRDGEWVITDLTVDGVSTAETYKTQFQNRIRQRGFDALLEVIKKRAQENTGV